MNNFKEQKNVCCPHCGNEINIDEILYKKIEEEQKKQNLVKEKQLKKLESDINDRVLALTEQEKNIEKETEKRLKEKEPELRQSIEKECREEYEEEQRQNQQELNELNNKVNELNRAKLEVEKLKRKNARIESEAELKYEKIANETVEEERLKISKKESEKNELKIADKDKIIEQLKNALSDAQRKAEQGSVQLQGEVQELGIEEWLRTNFPLDTIDEIKKGQRGADCIQIVNTYTKQNCGTIYYESKRTKEFQNSWVEKFKNDMREKKASIGVIITDTLPKNFERVGMLEGVWICTYQEFKGLCFVLRESLIQVSNVINTQENKGDKMQMLYSFLISNDFRLQVEAIVEGFTQMEIDLNKEKRSIQALWKKRELQIQKVLLNTNYMYSSIRGIAGNAVQPIKELEFTDEYIEELEND